jgi:hypothetical protein
MWNLLLPTCLQGLAILDREGKYKDSLIWTTFSWLVRDQDFKSFQELAWRSHTAASEDVVADQATLNGILQAVLVTKKTTIDSHAKVLEAADTATKSAADIAECQKEIKELKQKLCAWEAVQSSISTPACGTPGLFLENK